MYNNKIIGLILPTRYGSSRLNGKVLCEINGRLQIERIIERALQSYYIDNIILAVTDKKDENEPIKDWYKQNKFKYSKLNIFFGEHDNIIKRCLNAAIKNNIDIIVDISHDCTFFDPRQADLLIERLFAYNADYSANCITRSFPDGFDIQVYTTKIYQKIYDETQKTFELAETNYWTGWNIRQQRENIWPKPRFINFESRPEWYYPEWHLCLDNENDKKLIEKICYHFENELHREISDYGCFEIINYLKENPDLLKINEKSIPNRIDRQE
jgi:spore coat polysaccharide biosynthesis protein SpsF